MLVRREDQSIYGKDAWDSIIDFFSICINYNLLFICIFSEVHQTEKQTHSFLTENYGAFPCMILNRKLLVIVFNIPRFAHQSIFSSLAVGYYFIFPRHESIIWLH